jgi:hypothetical protein
MEKSPPNQIVNLQNNFFLSQSLFFLISKGILPIQVFISNCANLFAQFSSKNKFPFSTKKVDLSDIALRSFQQNSVTSLLNALNLYNFLYKIQLSVYICSEVIKNYNKKPACHYMAFLLLNLMKVLSILKNNALIFISITTIFNLKYKL